MERNAEGKKMKEPRAHLDDFNSTPAADAPSWLTTYEEQLRVYEQERSDPDWQPVRLGFGSLDRDMRGISPGQVLGIAARSSVGKTWLLETIEHNFSIRRDAGILSLSLEMPAAEWAERALAIHENVAPEMVETWAKANELLDRAGSFIDRMRNVRLCEHAVSLDDLAGLTFEARMSMDVPLRLVLIDYLGLIDARGRDTYERVSQIGRDLKKYAKAERVALVVAMQLSRAAGDGSVAVSKEMLRDSGVLEESVDFLLGCWRPGKADGSEEALDVLRVKLLKSRKGEDGRIVDLTFSKQSRRLIDEVAEVDEVLRAGGRV
jgi:replicative DNA helicase